MIFFGLLGTAEVKQGLAASLAGGHAVAQVFFDGHFEMSVHFRLEILIQLRAAEEGQEALKRLANRSHGHSYLRAIMGSTRVARRAGM